MIEQIELLLENNDFDSFKSFFTIDKVDCLTNRMFRDVMLYLTDNLEFFIYATQIKEPFWKECFLLAFYKSNKKTCQYILSIGKFDIDILIKEGIGNCRVRDNDNVVKIYVNDSKFGYNKTIRFEINSIMIDQDYTRYKNHIDEYVSSVFPKCDIRDFNKWIYHAIPNKSYFTDEFKKIFEDDITSFLFFIYIIPKMIDSPLFDFNVFLYYLKEFII